MYYNMKKKINLCNIIYEKIFEHNIKNISINYPKMSQMVVKYDYHTPRNLIEKIIG